MKDETYLYISEVRDRKTLARNGRYKKNGCKSKKCTLPTDYRSRKEIAAMNGEVKSFKMTDFYTWEDFLGMSEDIQIEYLQGIVKRYKCSLSAISAEVFRKSASYLGKYVKDKMLPIQVPIISGYVAKRGRELLKADVQKDRTSTELKPEQDRILSVKSVRSANISSMTMTLDSFDDGVWSMLKDMFYNKKVSIMIDIHEYPCYEYAVGHAAVVE